MNGLPDVVGELKSITGGYDGCGWMCDSVAFLLYALVKFTRPDLVIQTGHLWGKSALMVLEAMNDGFITSQPVEKDDGLPGDTGFTVFLQKNTPESPASPRMISVDPLVAHEGGLTWMQARYPGFGFRQQPSQVFFRGEEAAGLAVQYAGRRVLVVVDGDHSEAAAAADLDGALVFGRPFIYLDDTRWIPHLGRLAREFAAAHAYQVLELPLYNGVCLLVPEVTG